MKHCFANCLIAFAFSSVLQAYRWSPTPDNDAHVGACVGGNVSFPWSIVTDGKEEKIIDIDWLFQAPGKANVSIASYGYGNIFTKANNERFTFTPNAGLHLEGAQTDDAGRYYVKVILDDPKGHLTSAESMVTLSVEDRAPAVQNDAFLVTMSDAIWNDVIDDWTLQLGCGRFVNFGHPPVDIIWTMPSGEVRNSSHEDNGTFVLSVSSPIQGGNYSCHLPPSAPAARCLTVTSPLTAAAQLYVDDKDVRLSLLELLVHFNKLVRVNSDQASLLHNQSRFIQDQASLLKNQSRFTLKDQDERLRDHEIRIQILDSLYQEHQQLLKNQDQADLLQNQSRLIRNQASRLQDQDKRLVDHEERLQIQDRLLQNQSRLIQDKASRLRDHDSRLQDQDTRLGDHEERLQIQDSLHQNQSRLIQDKASRLKNHDSRLQDQDTRLGDHEERLQTQDSLLHNQSRFTQDQAGLLQDHDSLLQDQASLLNDHDRRLGDQAGLLKNQSRLIQDKASRLKNHDSRLQDLAGLLKNQSRLIQDKASRLKNHDSRLEDQDNRLVDHEERLQIQDSLLKNQSHFTQDQASLLKVHDSRLQNLAGLLENQSHLIQNKASRLQYQETRLLDHEERLQIQDSLLKDQDSRLQDQARLLQYQSRLIQDQASLLKDQDSRLKDQDSRLQDQASLLQNQSRCIQDKTSHQDDIIDNLKVEITNLKSQFSELNNKADTVLDYQGTFSSCVDWLAVDPRSGVRTLTVHGEVIRVYCDQTTDGGGWTVFQRRQDGSVDFYRGWEAYRSGFGDLQGNFWLGLDNLHSMTSCGDYLLRIDLKKFDGTNGSASYTGFQIAGVDQNFRLNVDSFAGGNAGDSLSYHNNQQFTTRDADHDAHRVNCARTRHGAWWYKACYHSNLNGRYTDSRVKGKDVVVFDDFDGFHSLKFSEMKMRPILTSGQNEFGRSFYP